MHKLCKSQSFLWSPQNKSTSDSTQLGNEYTQKIKNKIRNCKFVKLIMRNFLASQQCCPTSQRLTCSAVHLSPLYPDQATWYVLAPFLVIVGTFIFQHQITSFTVSGIFCMDTKLRQCSSKSS